MVRHVISLPQRCPKVAQTMNKQVLTDRFVNSRKPAPPGTRAEFYDATVPGLALRVTDKGSKSYVLIARYPSNPKNPTRRALTMLVR